MWEILNLVWIRNWLKYLKLEILVRSGRQLDEYMKLKRYSKKWFYNFFSKLKAKGQLGIGSLEKKCALWHIGVRISDEGESYKFPNKNVKRKFNALCKILGQPSLDYIQKPNWKAIYYLNDNNQLLAKLKRQ